MSRMSEVLDYDWKIKTLLIVGAALMAWGVATMETSQAQTIVVVPPSHRSGDTKRCPPPRLPQVGDEFIENYVAWKVVKIDSPKAHVRTITIWDGQP